MTKPTYDQLLEALRLCASALEVRDSESEDYAAKNARSLIADADSE